MTNIHMNEGRIDIASVERLSRDELREWVYERLHGRDTQIPADARQGESLHYLFENLYEKVSRDTRIDVRKVVQDAVREMARDKNTTWRGPAGHELLLLAQTVCDQQEILDWLLEMATDERFYTGDPAEPTEDLHYRVLQSLVAVGWRGQPEFWRRQADLDPERYAGVAFDGLSIVGPEDAINLLCDLPWSEAVEHQLHFPLEYLLQTSGGARLVALLQKYLPQMAPRIASFVKSVCAELKIDLQTAASRCRSCGCYSYEAVSQS